jgi:hypothetical protein
MKQRHLLVAGLCALVAASAALVMQHDQESAARERALRAISRVPARSAPNDAIANGTRTARSAPLSEPRASVERRDPDVARRRPDEAAIMSELRALAQSSPERSLELVREADARFPGSEDAPERWWFKIRSLVNLGRLAEAHSEATVMVDTFRDTPWAGDVERHLLTHPLDHPAQRGNLPE